MCQSCHVAMIKVRHIAPNNWIIFFNVLLVLFGLLWLSKPGMDPRNSLQLLANVFQV